MGDEEHRQVLEYLHHRYSGFDRLEYEEKISGQYLERRYFSPYESECLYDNNGLCVSHKAIHNYLAQGYLPIDTDVTKDDIYMSSEWLEDVDTTNWL